MTAQEPEILIYKDHEFSMITEPNPEPGCEYLLNCATITSNYRGYVGTWEIRDDKLYLNNVNMGRTKNYPDPVFANWVSMNLEVWYGNLLKYVHAGYGSMYEENIIFKIESGILKDIRIIDNTNNFKINAINEVRQSKNKTNINYLYSIYLSNDGSFQTLIDKSTFRKDFYIELQKELELEFKKKLIELSKDPNSGIILKYKQ